MGALEKPDLHAYAMRTVYVKFIAAITALWKIGCFGQPDSFVAPNPRFLISISILYESAGIIFKRQPRDFYAPPVVRFAREPARDVSIPQCQIRFQLGEHSITHLLHNLGADCLATVLGRGCSVCLRGISWRFPSN